ncbi:unnamed protein product [Linum trigynum]|uniref:Uncharacterized protein n=1 Tax=Linum trigynum TaxID=586398 RepID=A0AAV2G3T0_9ROSI
MEGDEMQGRLLERSLSGSSFGTEGDEMLAGWSLGVVELTGGGRDGTQLRVEASCSWVATGRRLAAGSRRHVAERRERTATPRRPATREGRSPSRWSETPSMARWSESLRWAMPRIAMEGFHFTLEGEGGGRRQNEERLYPTSNPTDREQKLAWAGVSGPRGHGLVCPWAGLILSL